MSAVETVENKHVMHNTQNENLDTTLNERGKRYGIFTTHATITQDLKHSVREAPGWDRLSDSQKECVEMIFHKIGRAVNGDPNWADTWVDIAGYAMLVAKELDGTLV